MGSTSETTDQDMLAHDFSSNLRILGPRLVKTLPLAWLLPLMIKLTLETAVQVLFEKYNLLFV